MATQAILVIAEAVQQQAHGLPLPQCGEKPLNMEAYLTLSYGSEQMQTGLSERWQLALKSTWLA
jgi:hypothetical protein